jgi:hypothetical protein
MMVDSARRILARAAAQVGGIPHLASELKLSESALRHYILGREPIPEALMLRVIDVLLEQFPEPPRAQ